MYPDLPPVFIPPEKSAILLELFRRSKTEVGFSNKHCEQEATTDAVPSVRSHTSSLERRVQPEHRSLPKFYRKMLLKNELVRFRPSSVALALYV